MTPSDRSESAFKIGKEFGKIHPFSEFSQDKDSSRLMSHCPFYLQEFADVFKYGCQSAWRRKGELGKMLSYDLEPGDIFTVDKPDPESSTRICLTNNVKDGLRFGFPSKSVFWCYMGIGCEVTLVQPTKEQ